LLSKNEKNPQNLNIEILIQKRPSHCIKQIFLLPSLVFAGVNNKPKINYEALDKIPSNGLARVMGEGMAKSLPVQLDVLTRTTRVSVDENIITTFKEINTEHDSIKSVNVQIKSVKFSNKIL
jgi:hypothetical protein